MRYRETIISLMFLLSGCGQGDVDLAEQKIRGELKDPDSAVFSRVRVADKLETADPTVVCGLVNAKNSFGGYVGARRFYVTLPSGIATIEPDPDSNDQIDSLSRQIFERQWAISLCELRPE